MIIRYFLGVFLVFLTTSFLSYGQEKYLDSLIQWTKDHSRIDSVYITNLHRISYRTSEKDVATSFEYYEKVMSYSNELNFTYGKSLAQINLGVLLSNSANFDASNEAYFKAIDYAKEADAPRLISISLNNIGENFKSLKDWGKCREYTYKAVDINKEIEAWRGVAINYELLHNCNFEEFLYKEAKRDLDSGFQYALMSDDSYVISSYYLGYGKLASNEGNMQKSKEFFDKAMTEAQKENDLRNKYFVYMARAGYLDDLAPEKKLSYLDSAYLIAVNTQYLEGVGKAAQELSGFYDKKAKIDSSAKYFHIYRAAYDSIFSENNKRNVVVKEFDWLIKQKELENKHLQELAVVQKRDISVKNILLAALVALLILGGVAAFFVYKSIQITKNRQISEFQRKMLQVKMESLQLQMNPHFIFNSLNSIENFVMQNDKLAASLYLNKFAFLVRTILDSSKMDKVSFESDLKATQAYIDLERLRVNNKFELIKEIDEKLLNEKFHVPPFVIQPYIENAIIHGLSPSEKEGLYLKIQAYLENGFINYIVEDNGIGRKQSEEYRNKNSSINHKSLGMRLSREKLDIFSRQNKTTANIDVIDLFDNEESLGTRIILKIKIN